MVSLSSVGEWEKFARMFYFNKEFQVIFVNTKDLVGPTFLAGNRILHNGEILAIVPDSSIMEVKSYSWQPAEQEYDYEESSYTDDYDKDFYERLVVNRTRGFKPKQL